jgi:CRP/FNR family transcriptional regulator, dissimilatory nitrate respiration regulator
LCGAWSSMARRCSTRAIRPWRYFWSRRAEFIWRVCQPTDRPTILQVAEAGDSFAEASLPVAHYHCDAIAETDAVIEALPRAALLAGLAADPAECLALVMVLARYVRDLPDQLALRDIRSAPARLLAWLRLHAAGDPPVVVPQRPWTLIAGEIGLTREAAYRALAALVQDGRIRREEHAVHLLARP